MAESSTNQPPPPRRRQLPWARIWAEGPVIVVSILLAFSIEAWWEGVQERGEVADYLTALRMEFDEGRLQLDSVTSRNERSIAATLVMVSLTVEEARAVDPDSAYSLYTGMMLSATFDPSLGVLSALQSSGSLDDVEDLELRAALGGWPGLIEDSREDIYPIWETALATVDRWGQLGSSITMLHLSEGIGGSQPAKDFLVALAGDDETRNHLAARAAFNRVYQLELDGLVARIEHILALLDQELTS